MLINEKSRNELVKMAKIIGIVLSDCYKSPDKYKTPQVLSKDLVQKWYEFDFSCPPTEEHLSVIYEDVEMFKGVQHPIEFKRLINNYLYYQELHLN